MDSKVAVPEAKWGKSRVRRSFPADLRHSSYSNCCDVIVVVRLLSISCVVDYWTCPSNAIDKVGVRISRYVEVPLQLICVVIIFVVLFLLLVFLPSSTPESLTPSLLVPWHFDWFAIDLFVDAVVLVNVNGRHEELIDTSSLLCWFHLYCLLLC